MTQIKPQKQVGGPGSALGVIECEIKVHKKRDFKGNEDLEKSVIDCCNSINFCDLFTTETQIVISNSHENVDPICKAGIRIYFKTENKEKVSEFLQGELISKIEKDTETQDVKILSINCKRFNIIIAL